MLSQKRISSIAQSIAHHAVSGVCSVNPHLRKACTDLRRHTCEIDLLAEVPCPPEYSDVDPIRFSISALKEKFIAIASSEGFSIKDFREVLLIYEFPEFLDDYSSNCRVRIVSNSNYVVDRAVDQLGNKAETLRFR
jgi:hypothetical protein